MAFRYAAFRWVAAVCLVAPAPTWAGDEGAASRSESEASALVELVEELRRELVGVKEEVRQLRGEVEALKAGRSLEVEVGGVWGGASVEEPRAQIDGDRLEEEQVLQRTMLETLYQTKVESGSRYRVRLSGIALFNAFATSAGGESFDVPELAEPPNPLHSGTSYGTTMRQSIVGLGVSGPTVAGARSSGELQFDFFGGFPESGNGVTTGLARLRTASMRLDWGETSIVFGQTEPFVSPLSPSSLASLAIPALSYSGNLWAWVPQVSVERRLALDGRGVLTLTGGLLDPLTGDEPVDLGNFQPGAGHRGGWPALAGRLGWRSGEAERSMGLGVGGYYERQDWGPDRIVNGWATTADWIVPVADRLSLSGELYSGRAFGGLGAGGERQRAVRRRSGADDNQRPRPA